MVSIMDFINHTKANVGVNANYYAYSFPSSDERDAIAVKFIRSATGSAKAPLHSVTVQFVLKYRDLSEAEDVANQILDYYFGKVDYNISDTVCVINTKTLSAVPVVIGYTEAWRSLMIIDIEFRVADCSNGGCGTT